MLAHNSLARIWPEFAIEEADANELAAAFCNYARHTRYNMDPRTRDLGALILCVAMIEGPRILRVAAKAKEGKKRSAVPAPGTAGWGAAPNVVNIGP